LQGCSFRRVLRTQALRRGDCRARHLGDRPPAVPAVSRCRARQHHGQAVSLAPDAPIAVKASQRPGPERRALSGSAPPASRAHGRLGSGSGRRVSTPGDWAGVQPLAETVSSLAVRRAVPLKGCRARRRREHGERDKVGEVTPRAPRDPLPSPAPWSPGWLCEACLVVLTRHPQDRSPGIECRPSFLPLPGPAFRFAEFLFCFVRFPPVYP
jgi:hypothetical protein